MSQHTTPLLWCNQTLDFAQYTSVFPANFASFLGDGYQKAM